MHGQPHIRFTIVVVSAVRYLRCPASLSLPLFPSYVHFFILSILDFLADLLITSISVDKILFVSLVGIYHTSAPYTEMLWIIVNFVHFDGFYFSLVFWDTEKRHDFYKVKQKVKVKQSLYSPGQFLSVPGCWGCQISRQSAHEDCKVVSPTHRPPLRPADAFVLEAESTPGT